MRRFILVLLIGLGPHHADAAPPARVAVTFDDLPALTLVRSQDYVDETNDAILRGLKRHRIPAIGFVNEGKLNTLDRTRQIANLRKWTAAGMALGNHTFDHLSPNGVTAAAYIDGISRGETVTRALLKSRGKTLRWFRHPYLETGAPLEQRQAIDEWLATHDYRIAPVTMENSDWLFAEPYDDAVARHDDIRARSIKAAYLAYTEKMVVWYPKASQALFGRRIAFILLLHVTRLNADSIDDLAAVLKRANLRPVTLETAMRDPAYATKDDYAGPDGIEWLERWSMSLKKDLPWADFTDPPKEIEADYRRVDPDP